MWHSGAGMYLAIAFVLGIVALHSFPHDGYWAIGDWWPAPFVPDNQTMNQNLPIWGTAFGAFGSPQFSTFYVLLALIGAPLLFAGLPGPWTAWVVTSALFMFEGLGAVFFVRTLFPDKKLAAFIVGLALPLSLHNALTLANPLQTFAVGYLPWLAGLLVRRVRTPVPWWRLGAELSLASLGIAVLAQTPPLAITAIVWAAGWLVVGWWRWRNARTTILGLALGLAGGLLANLWWIYEAYIALYANGGEVQAVFADPLSWSWVDAHASVLNLLTSRSYWAWPDPYYFPWSGVYSQGLLLWSLYIPLAFAAVGVVAHFRNRTVWLALTMLVLALFLAKGVHDPLGQVNVFLYQHLPLFWLLRDPQVEVNGIMYLLLFTLAALGADAMNQLAGRLWAVVPAFRSKVRVLQGGIGVVATCLLTLNGYAIVSGSFIPASQLNGVSQSVLIIPTYWPAAGAYLNRQPDTGRVLLLPPDDFYAMPYTWGHYGPDVVAQTFIAKPVVTNIPLGYLADSAGLHLIEDDIVASMRTDSPLPIAPVLRVLDIRWILLRHDIRVDMPGRTILNPVTLATYLQQQPDMTKVATFGALDIYRVEGPESLVQTYAGAGDWRVIGAPNLTTTTAAAGQAIPWLEGVNLPLAEHHALQVAGGQMAVAQATPAGSPLPAMTAALVMPVTVEVEGTVVDAHTYRVSFASVVLRSRDGEQSVRTDAVFSLPDVDLRQLRTFTVIVNGQHFAAPPNPVAVGVVEPLGSLAITSPQQALQVELWGGTADVLENAPWTPLGDCFATDQMTPEQAHLDAQPLPNGGVTLSALYHAACVTKQAVVPSSTSGVLFTEVASDHRAGTAPAIAIAVDQQVVTHESLPATSGWQSWSSWTPLQGEKAVSLYVYAYGDGHVVTINDYRDIHGWVMQPLGQQRVEVSAQRITTSQPATVTLPAQATPVLNLLRDPTFADGLWSPPFNALASPPLTFAAAGLRATTTPDGVLDLQAQQEGIGEGQTVPVAGAQELDFTAEVRCVRGAAPAVVILDGSGNTLWRSALAGCNSTWQPVTASVVTPEGASAVQLYLYAYANGTVTESQYRNLSLVQRPGGSATIVWASGIPPLLTSQNSSSLDPTAVTYSVPIAPGTQLIVLANSFAAGWVLTSDTGILPWTHVPVDGFLNGWVVPSGTTITQVQAIYFPALIEAGCLVVSLLTLGACAALLVFSWRNRGTKDRTTPPSI